MEQRMSTDSGVFGTYGQGDRGFDGGYTDLHDTSANPHTRSSPGIDGVADTGVGFGPMSPGPMGYYTNPPTVVQENPYSASAIVPRGSSDASESARSVDGFDQIGVDRNTPQPEPTPSSSDYWYDLGYGKNGEGRS